MNNNDERIMELKGKIAKKREELKKKKQRFYSITNRILILDGVTYNLNVSCDIMLLVRLNIYKMSAENLDIDISTLMISGYSLADWISDVENTLEVQSYKEEKRKLDALEKQLTALLSNDKQTELQIDNLAALLN